MIVSIDAIMCGKQIVLLFGQETFVVVETSKILLLLLLLLLLLFFFLKKGLLLLKKHFETGRLMLPKKYLFTLPFYSTSSKYSYNKAQRPKHTCQM